MAWLGDWAKRIEITVDNTNIDSDLTHFPVPIILGASVGQDDDDVSCIFDELSSDANRKKIAVTKADGTTQIYVEIELWDDANEKAVLWVSKSDLTLNSSSTTTLYIYYDSEQSDNTSYVGDVGSTPAENVWSSNFSLNYNLAQDPSGGASCIKDSTSNGNDATPTGFVAGDLVDALIGKGLNIDAGNDKLETDSLETITGKFYFSLFINMDSWGDEESLFGTDDYKDGRVAFWGDSRIEVTRAGNVITKLDWSTPVFPTDAWEVLTITRDASNTISAWVGATKVATGAGSGNIGFQRLFRGPDNSAWEGLKDAIVGSVLLWNGEIASDAWIKANVYARKDDLLTFGAEEGGKTTHDLSLDLGAYYQHLENLKSMLRAHDGTELRDLATILRAHDGTEFRDLKMLLWAVNAANVFEHLSAITGSGSPNYLSEPRGIVVEGNYAYVASFDNDALTIFDISDPVNPAHVGAITGQGSPNYLYGASCIAKQGDYVYIASYHDDALTIFDVSNPTNPVLAGSFIETPDPYYLQNAVAIAVAGSYAYVLSQAHAALSIWDISDPEAISYMGAIAGSGAPNYLGQACNVVVSGDYAYVVSTSDNALTIFDISDPTEPVHVGAITGAGAPNYLGYPMDLAVSGNYAYVICSQSLGVGDNALTIFDVSNPASPTHVGEYAEPAYPTPPVYLKQPRGLKLYGNYAYIACYGGTFSVINVTNPAAPVHADTIEGSGSPYYLGWAKAIDVQDGIACIVAETSSALTIFNVSKFTGISAYQKFDYMRMVLEVLAVDPSVFRDLIMNLEAWGVHIDNFKALLEAARDKYKDLTMLLEATDGTLLKNLTMLLEATDGTVFNNFVLQLQCIAATPVFRSVTAHRVSSVAHEVV